MSWGGPEFVLAIIAMAMLSGVIRTLIRAKHGLPDPEPRRGRHGRRLDAQENADKVVRLTAENQRLTDRLEASEDRLAVLERIVTDRGYSLADEIEALRDRPARPATSARSADADAGTPLTFKDREEA